MRKRLRLAPILLSLVALLPALIWLWLANGGRIPRLWMESLLQSNMRQSSLEKIHLREAHLSRDLKLHLKNLSGTFQASGGEVLLEVAAIDFQDSLTYLLVGKTVRITFDGARLSRSIQKGIRGEAILKPGPVVSFDLSAEVEALGLDDLVWIAPENLTGSTGLLSGTIRIQMPANGHPGMSLDLRVPQPGGKIQSQFFDLLTPYLPAVRDRAKMLALQKAGGLVAYQHADLKAELASADTMKIVLHILVPDYNLDLNLNVEVRVDRENAFGDALRLLGLLQEGPA